MDCVDHPQYSLNDGAASEMTEGELCPDNEKSGSIWPSVAVWMPNPLPYGQKLISTFLEARSSAAIGPSLGSHLGNVGLDGIDVLSRDCLIRYVITEQKLR